MGETMERLVAWWEAERDGPDEDFTMASEVIAVDGDTAVAELSHVSYRSAEIQDMAAVTAAIQAKGALAGTEAARCVVKAFTSTPLRLRPSATDLSLMWPVVLR